MGRRGALKYKILVANMFGTWVLLKDEEDREMEFESIDEAKEKVAELLRNGKPANGVKIVHEIPFEVKVK